jgi:hypothetical protein
MPKSYYLCNKMLDANLRGVAYVPPSAVYVGLFSTAPTVNTPGVEITGNGYTRQVVIFGAPVNGVSSNTADVVYPAATPADWGTITSFGIFDSPAGGNLLYFATLSSSRYIAVNDQVKFPIGQLIASET